MMGLSHVWSVRGAIVLVAALLTITKAARGFTPSEPGLYAVFDTSAGEFTASLLYNESPMTVANFVGLAEGTQVWVDENGIFRKAPFYDRLTFHRVIQDFVIQAGSRNGQGTDGPGYFINDEINVDLTHNGAGVLSMANSGPNSGSSQFFITLDQAQFLDLKHAIFGFIVEGLGNVNAIGNVQVDQNEKPINDIVINSIKIVREGAEAEAFDANAWQLPKLTDPKATFSFGQGEAKVEFFRQPISEYFIRQTSDLKNWEQTAYFPTSSEATPSESFDFYDELLQSNRQFFQVSEFTEPELIDKPGSVVTLNLGGSPITINLGEDFGGTYSFEGQTWAIEGYLWLEVGNLIQLFIFYQGDLELYPMQIYFDITTSNQGNVLAYVFESQPGAGDDIIFEGTFTFTPAQ